MTETCVNGHPWDEANTYVYPDGHARYCRECRRGADRRRRGSQPSSFDPVAVDRAIAGDLNGTPLNAAERQEAVRRLTAVGTGGRRIAEQIGCTPRTVHRIRTRRRSTQ